MHCPDAPCVDGCKEAGWGCVEATFYRKNKPRTARKEHKCTYGFTIPIGRLYSMESLFIKWYEEAGGKIYQGRKEKKCLDISLCKGCYGILSK